MIIFKNITYLPTLVGLIVAALIIIFFGNTHRRKIINFLKKEHGLNILKHSNLSQSGRRLRYTLLILSLIIVAFCLLRPQGNKIPQEKISSSRSILFLVDISKSMNVKDMNEQSRLDYAKWWAKKLMTDVPGDRYGLITFSKIAYIESPLTSDPEMVQLYLADLNSSLLPSGGTNIAEALDHAQQQFKENERDSRVVVLLSDGETKDDLWKKTLDELNKKKIPVNVIGLGNPKQSGLVLDDRGRPIQSSSNSYVMSLSDTSTLKQIADETGGVYVPWDPEDALKSGHEQIIQRIAELEYDDESSEKVELREELFMYFLPLAIILLCIRLWTSESKKRIITTLIFVSLFSNPTLRAQQVLPQALDQKQQNEIDLKEQIKALSEKIDIDPQPLKSFEIARIANAEFNAPAQALLIELRPLLMEAQLLPELILPAQATITSLEHKAALESKPQEQLAKLNSVVDNYINLVSQFPNSPVVQENLDLAIQQRDKIKDQQQDQQKQDQQNKDQDKSKEQQQDQDNKDQEQNQDKKDQGKSKDEQKGDQQKKDQDKSKDEQKGEQQKKDPNQDPNQDSQQKGEQNSQANGKQAQQNQNKMTEAEAEAAFKDDLKRQQQLRDLIRRNREEYYNRIRPFNPDQDK